MLSYKATIRGESVNDCAIPFFDALQLAFEALSQRRHSPFYTVKMARLTSTTLPQTGTKVHPSLNASNDLEAPLLDPNLCVCLQDIDLSTAGFPVTQAARSIVFVLGGPGSGKGTQVYA